MKLLLVANHLYDQAVEALYTTKLWLEDSGVEVELVSSGDLTFDTEVFHDLAARKTSFDLVCVFGGDGTLLRAAHVVAGTEVPLLGFNYGDVGFLAGATADSVTEALTSFFAGETVVEQRMMLEARITYSNGAQEKCSALNEISIGRSDLGRNIRLKLAINGDHLFELRGDGAIIATATGSTAYALAAGGPLLAPGHRGLCVVPVCPHPYATPAIVTSPQDVIELTMLPQRDQAALITIDGQSFSPASSLKPTPGSSAQATEHAHVDSLSIVRAPVGLALVRYNTPDFYTSLAALFDGVHNAR